MTSLANIAAPNLVHAWSYFTVSGTTVTLRQNYGIFSVVRNSTGSYQVNMLSGLTDGNYCIVAMADNLSGSGNLTVSSTSRGTSSFVLTITLGTGTLTDPSGVSVTVFGK